MEGAEIPQLCKDPAASIYPTPAAAPSRRYFIFCLLFGTADIKVKPANTCASAFSGDYRQARAVMAGLAISVRHASIA